MQLILDRFEENSAVCEVPDGTTVVLLRSQLPKNATSGCVLVQDDSGSFQIDLVQTQKRRERITALQKKLFRK